MTLSAGVAVRRPGAGDGAGAALRRADTALYAAKAGGATGSSSTPPRRAPAHRPAALAPARPQPVDPHPRAGRRRGVERIDHVAAAACRKRSAGTRPGSASQTSPRASTRRGSSASSASTIRCS